MQDYVETWSEVKSLSLIFLFLMILEEPFCTLACIYKRRTILAYVDLADVCGPCRIAASICSMDHA